IVRAHEVLEGEVVGIIAGPEASRAPEVGDPGFGRDAGAGESHDPAGRGQKLRRTVEPCGYLERLRHPGRSVADGRARPRKDSVSNAPESRVAPPSELRVLSRSSRGLRDTAGRRPGPARPELRVAGHRSRAGEPGAASTATAAARPPPGAGAARTRHRARSRGGAPAPSPAPPRTGARNPAADRSRRRRPPATDRPNVSPAAPRPEPAGPPPRRPGCDRPALPGETGPAR